MKPPVLIIHAPGTNRDHDAAEAFALAGGRPEIVTLSALAETPSRVRDYRLVCVPGGFSFGDDLGAGRVFALTLVQVLGDVLREHLAAGRPILGICNGFQTLVKAGFLPGVGQATLTRNLRGHFECRRVELVPSAASTSPWITPLARSGHRIHCPVAHGEGRLVPGDDATAEALRGPLGALRYVPGDAADGYPGNPNGSFDDLAGITDASGLVLGLMPHPEDAVLGLLDPDPHRRTPSGLPLFEAGLALAADTA
ncbi:MAG: phosphoribosylformylglycinamidine synthase subunit PurQ [Deltaproteobacteria bacterium]|nr:phosphoribosylformylglycinamidine synthase subunit PurQ [Deltaproteobacteria bacterium]